MNIKRGNESKPLALICAKSAIDKKAENSIIFDMQKLDSFTDYFLVTSGNNERQAQAIADEIMSQGRALGFGTALVEGYNEGRWILVDFGSVVCHVFHESIREFYNIEELYAAASRVAIPADYYTSAQSPALSAQARA